MIEDTDGDGVPEVALSLKRSFSPESPSFLTVFSGANGESVLSRVVEATILTELRSAGDIDHDGAADIITVIYRDSAVILIGISGRTGEELFERNLRTYPRRFEPVGDLNGDGIQEFLLSFSHQWGDGSDYLVYSAVGDKFAENFSLDGRFWNETSIDVNGDGVRELFLYGSSLYNTPLEVRDLTVQEPLEIRSLTAGGSIRNVELHTLFNQDVGERCRVRLIAASSRRKAARGRGKVLKRAVVKSSLVSFSSRRPSAPLPGENLWISAVARPRGCPELTSTTVSKPIDLSSTSLVDSSPRRARLNRSKAIMFLRKRLQRLR
ncbi:VCBS repeat-containing protein [bacterium]|nr:VCBS repeat-containing protein [bacterium]